MSLAISTASSSESKGIIERTGPKISSRAMVMSLDTPPEHSLQYASDASGPVDVPVLHPNGNATLGDGFSYDP